MGDGGVRREGRKKGGGACVCRGCGRWSCMVRARGCARRVRGVRWCVRGAARACLCAAVNISPAARLDATEPAKYGNNVKYGNNAKYGYNAKYGSTANKEIYWSIGSYQNPLSIGIYWKKGSLAPELHPGMSNLDFSLRNLDFRRF